VSRVFDLDGGAHHRALVRKPRISSCDRGGERLVGDRDGPRDLADLERDAIVVALAAVDGNRRRAAELLGIAERTLYDQSTARSAALPLRPPRGSRPRSHRRSSHA